MRRSPRLLPSIGLLLLAFSGPLLRTHELAAQGVAKTAAPVPSEALAMADRFATALKAGDRAAVLACLAPEAVIFEHGGAELSREEYAEHHLDGDLEYLRSIQVRVLDRRVLDGGDRVLVLTRSESSGQFRDKPVASVGTETLVLERRGDGWVIVHVHWSSGKRG
jgi:ketosteroid isomerase-like protein